MTEPVSPPVGQPPGRGGVVASVVRNRNDGAVVVAEGRDAAGAATNLVRVNTMPRLGVRRRRRSSCHDRSETPKIAEPSSRSPPWTLVWPMPITQLGAVEVLAQDDVDHAADGVGTVHGGRAVGQDFDALDRGERDRVEVGADWKRTSGWSGRDGRRSGPAYGRSRDRAGRWSASDCAELPDCGLKLPNEVKVRVTQHVGHGHVAAGVDAGAVDHDDRNGAFDIGALQARTGDFDAVKGLGVGSVRFSWATTLPETSVAALANNANLIAPGSFLRLVI